jgi:hypothetical protein
MAPPVAEHPVLVGGGGVTTWGATVTVVLWFADPPAPTHVTA